MQATILHTPIKNQLNRKIVLSDGRELYGKGFGGTSDAVCELVFNTSMVGYQEILSDPSYTDQAVVMTYPIMGNYGLTDDDFESRVPSIGGFIVREYNDNPSNFRATGTLADIMEENSIPGIAGIDTRYLTRIIRDEGSQKCLITDVHKPLEECMSIINSTNLPTDAVSRVSTKKRWYSRTSNPRFHIVAIDCGMKLNIVRTFNKKRVNVTIVPYDTPAEEIRRLQPDGVFISNGPGDPTDAIPVIMTIKDLMGEIPIMGICLGHQIISLSVGATTYKLKFGHRGGNHPVKNLKTGKIEITSQNHSYAVKGDSLKNTPLEVTHINLLDNTIEGVRNDELSVMSVQYHPESAPGPQDSVYLFDEFIKMMERKKNA